MWENGVATYMQLTIIKVQKECFYKNLFQYNIIVHVYLDLSIQISMQHMENMSGMGEEARRFY